MDGWMDGWMDGRMDGLVSNGNEDEQVERMDELIRVKE